jgi:hypothetical protein
LDFLILPLIARKLIADFTSSLIGRDSFLLPVLLIALPLEMARIVIGIAVTMALTPLVLLIHAIKIAVLNPERHLGSSNQRKIEHLNLNVPEQFICPLSLVIMTNPVFVIAHPEQRFERSWIEMSLRQDPCNPLTREPLNLDGIQDDIHIKQQINVYIQEQLDNANAPSSAVMRV